jgi:hypothetical protein
MLSNNFWDGFLFGAALVFLIFFFVRLRAKKSGNPSTEK